MRVEEMSISLSSPSSPQGRGRFMHRLCRLRARRRDAFGRRPHVGCEERDWVDHQLQEGFRGGILGAEPCTLLGSPLWRQGLPGYA